MEFLVSRLRQGSSSTNTATHSERPQRHRKANKADPGSCPLVFLALCEFNIFDQQSAPRKNQFQAPTEAHGKTRSKRALLGRFKEPLNPDLGAISSHP